MAIFQGNRYTFRTPAQWRSGSFDNFGLSNDELVATGGRVLSVVATGSDFAEARSRAYLALEAIELEGGQYRSDIAARVAES